MPEGIGYGPDEIDELVQIATQNEIGFESPGVTQQGIPGNPVLRPSFQQGGVVPPAGGTPPGLAPQGAQSGPIPMAAMQQEVQRMTQQHPEQVLQIKQAVMQALQTGELTPQELNMAAQLATAAAQNPQLWPQLKRFAEEQGLAAPGELPEEYDSGLVFAMLLAAQAAQSESGGQPGLPQAAGQPPVAPGAPAGAPQANAQPPRVGLRTGGEVPNSRNTDGSVAATIHEGEFVIPKHVVLAKGTDFFNKMIDPDNGGTKAKA